MTFNRDNARHYGSKGGRTTSQRHGREHYSQIGRKGFERTTERYFDGDEAKHKSFLAAQCAYNYWLHSGRPMKYDVDGHPIWGKPKHPATKVNSPF